MRIRTVKPEFWQDEDLAEICETSRLVAIGLLNCADDEGFFNANEKLVKSLLFPITEPSVSIHECFNQLVKIGYLKLYKCKKGKKTYGHVINFTKHQKVNRPSPSKIQPLVDFTECSMSIHEQVTVGKEQGTGKGREQGANSSLQTIEDSPVCFQLALNDNSLFDVTENQCNKWANLYPAVNIDTELRKMIGWLDANPTKRKTRKGVLRFANNWISKVQDSGGSKTQTCNKDILAMSAASDWHKEEYQGF